MANERVYTRYLPAKGPGTNYLRVELYYDIGGMNYFTSKPNKRGYYLSVTPVDRGERGTGVMCESTTLGKGVKMLIKEVQRRSKKAAEEATTISKNYWHKLIDYVCQTEGIVCEAAEVPEDV